MASQFELKAKKRSEGDREGIGRRLCPPIGVSNGNEGVPPFYDDHLTPKSFFFASRRSS
jgi:hypothetical protein